jgi:hypothetical protein
MAESQALCPPRPTIPPPGVPLPRLWKVEPDPPPTESRKKMRKQGSEEGLDSKNSGRKGKRAKDEKSEKEKPEKTVLLEESPELAT